MKKRLFLCLISYSLCFTLLAGCGGTPSPSAPQVPADSLSAGTSGTDSAEKPPAASPLEEASADVFRDTAPYVPLPEAPGTVTCGNDVVTIDSSNAGDGYICVSYTGTCPKVKLILTGPDDYKCTYDISGNGFEAFPLTAGNGSYIVGIYENIVDTSYSTCFTTSLQISLTDEFAPYLRPSQYCAYTETTKSVKLASELSKYVDTDLSLVSEVYNYIIENIDYDHDKATAAVSGSLTGYISDIDASLEAGKGICLDYAAIMTSMLRSQRIPTRLEVGYAGDAYHAWISVYLKEIGWVNGIIQFDGKSWSLMDPTFGASTGEEELKKFIGDGSNYTVKYIY
ncbi:MAG: transglutaminase domain-containing protein [Lachnospiraceae bacterium]|nr:transglutaminase domain-containing protein [Lachnospiraceae bacterium]